MFLLIITAVVFSLKALGQACCAPTRVPTVHPERSVISLVHVVSTVHVFWGGERERERETRGEKERREMKDVKKEEKSSKMQ